MTQLEARPGELIGSARALGYPVAERERDETPE